MAGSTSKKIVILRFDREPVTGVANPLAFGQGESLELLSPEGAYAAIPWAHVKLVCFVRDYPTGRLALERTSFRNRPKGEGLWVRLTFKDGETMEGVLPNNLLQVEAFGFSLAPPEMANIQRVYVPRQALDLAEVLGVVGSPLRRKKAKETTGQIGLFEP